MYQGPQRQEWMNTAPQYYTPTIEPFGMNGGYMAPGMCRPPGNIGHHMPAGFPHQPYHMPPPGPIPTSNFGLRPVNVGDSRSPGIVQPSHQTNLYGNEPASKISPLHGYVFSAILWQLSPDLNSCSNTKKLIYV